MFIVAKESSEHYLKDRSFKTFGIILSGIFKRECAINLHKPSDELDDFKVTVFPFSKFVNLTFSQDVFLLHCTGRSVHCEIIEFVKGISQRVDLKAYTQESTIPGFRLKFVEHVELLMCARYMCKVSVWLSASLIRSIKREFRTCFHVVFGMTWDREKVLRQILMVCEIREEGQKNQCNKEQVK